MVISFQTRAIPPELRAVWEKTEKPPKADTTAIAQALRNDLITLKRSFKTKVPTKYKGT